MNISPDIFRMYDIRGVYGEDLTDETAYILGKGLGTYFQNNQEKKVVVGRDNRVSGENISQSLIKGLMETGCEVVNLNLSVTPLIYFSWYQLDANAAVMITASHNPAKYNGFKCSLKKTPMVGDDYQEVKQICLSGNFESGEGKLTNENIFPAYMEKIISSVKINRGLKVAIDCGNGTGSLFAPEVIARLGCEVVPIYCESDGNFPNHQPYPQKVEFYSKLKETIVSQKCDIGLAFDGDGDRLGVYDEKGTFIEADRLAMVFTKDICQKNKNKKIVMNTSTSMAVIDYIKENGGEFYLWKTGYPNITAKMNEIGAIFGGEISGHFFFKDKYFGYDDALYAGVRILEILSNSDNTLSQIISGLPKYFETREYRVEIPNDIDKSEMISEIKKELQKEYPGIEIIDNDGIRFSFVDGWGLIRPSNTEPLITGRAEGKTEVRLDGIKEIIKSKLSKYNILLNWEEF